MQFVVLFTLLISIFCCHPADSAEPSVRSPFTMVGLVDGLAMALTLLAVPVAVAFVVTIQGRRENKCETQATQSTWETAEIGTTVIWSACCLWIAANRSFADWSLAFCGNFKPLGIAFFVTTLASSLFAVWFLYGWQQTNSVSAGWQIAKARFRLQIVGATLPVMAFILFFDLVESWEWTREGTAWLFPLFLMLLVVLMPNFVLGILPSRSINRSGLASRLNGYAKRHRTGIGDIRLWDTRQRIINGMIVGIFGFNRTVYLSDRLICLMSQEEIDAIFLHELGHAKRNHLIARLAGAIVPFLLVQILLGPLVPELVAITIAMLVAFLIFGAVARWLEFDADRFAVRALDEIERTSGGSSNAQSLVSALETICADQPAAARSTWMHPGISSRIAAIQQWTQTPSLTQLEKISP